ncbi:MAG: lactonase family protein [Streptosporangiaceae bacterium]
MRSPRRIGSAAVLAAAMSAAVAAGAGPAGAATWHGGYPGARHAVFVQTDNTAGNQIAAYHRAADGTLTLAGTYGTGGRGGQLAGSVVDHLASQGSLTYDRAHRLLYAVNAGSNTVSVFAASGDRLHLRQVTGSGGTFPVSITVHGSVVYVLNALHGGSLQGYRVRWGRLWRIPGSRRELHLNPGATPQFVNTPGQAAFTPDGSQLVVTTKANGNDVDVFGVRPDGTLSAAPTVNSEPGAVPFAVTFDRAGNLVIAEAGPSVVATFTIAADGSLTQLDQAATGEQATCWVAADGARLFASDTGSSLISGYRASWRGALTALGQTSTDPGPVDAAVSPHGHYLYVQTGQNGVVDEFAVADGQLTRIGSVTVAGSAGGEGIAAG